MADDRMELPEAMIGVALIQEVIQGDLMADAPAEVLPFLSPNLNTEERMTLIQLQEMFRMIGDCLEKDPEFERLKLEAIEHPERFLEVIRMVLRDRITWDRIVVLFYLSCRLQARSLRNVLWWIVEKCENLLRWILDHGRWILDLDNSLFVRVILRCTLNFFCTKFLSWIHGRGRQDCIVEARLTRRIEMVCEGLRNDPEIQAVIDSIAQIPESSLESYNQVTQNAFAEGMTWERIIVLLFVFGELAVRMNHWSVRDFLRWTKNFFPSNRLSWAQERDRQIRGLSDQTASVNNTTSLTSSNSGLILTFIMGVAFGSFITWKATRTL